MIWPWVIVIGAFVGLQLQYELAAIENKINDLIKYVKQYKMRTPKSSSKIRIKLLGLDEERAFHTFIIKI